MTRKLPADSKERRAAWRRARAVCGLTDAQIADLLDRSVALVKHYKCASGTCPPWNSIRILQEHNLRTALGVISERYGEDAVQRLGEAA